MSSGKFLDGEYFEVNFTGNVLVDFGNLAEETGETVAVRIYGGKV